MESVWDGYGKKLEHIKNADGNVKKPGIELEKK